MSDTKTPAPLPPLLSDEILAHLNCRCENCVRKVAECLETARQEDAAKIARMEAVLQEAVNALHGLCHGPMSMEDAADAALAALSSAKSQLNIEPIKP